VVAIGPPKFSLGYDVESDALTKYNLTDVIQPKVTNMDSTGRVEGSSPPYDGEIN
jgi:hypothetical protein